MRKNLSWDAFCQRVSKTNDDMQDKLNNIPFIDGLFLVEVVAGNFELKEAEAAKWLTKDNLDSVNWLPADVTLIDKIRCEMS